MKEIMKNLKTIIDRRESMENNGMHPNTPEDLAVAIDTFFENCKMMIEYDLDYIPGETLADLVEVLAKYPRYHGIANDLVHTLNSEYNLTVWSGLLQHHIIYQLIMKDKRTRKEKLKSYKPTMAELPIPTTKVHKSKKKKSRAKEKQILAKELKQILRKDFW